MDDFDQARPNWMLDGKGIRGDAPAFQPAPMRFPGAIVSNMEAQLPVTSDALNDPGGGGTQSRKHNYTVVGTGSMNGVLVTPGNHFDPGSGMTITPTIGGMPITNATPPVLTVGSSDTVVYFHGTASGGVTSAIEILSGASVPASSTSGGDWYQLCANITNNSGNVTSNEGGVAGSQVMFCCNLSNWIPNLQ